MEPPRGRRDAAHSGGHCPRCQKRLVRPAVLEVELRELLMRIEHLRTLPHWLPLRPYFKNTRCHSNSKHDCVPDWNIEILECDKDCSFVKSEVLHLHSEQVVSPGCRLQSCHTAALH